MRLELAPGIGSALAGQARRAFPRECGGLLLGRSGRVTEAVALANDADRPREAYLARPGAVAAAFLDAHRRGLEVVGVYHSHPRGAAYPSAMDEDTCPPYCANLIVAPDRTGDAQVRGFYRDTVGAPLKEIELVQSRVAGS